MQTQVQQRRERMLKLLQSNTYASVEALSDQLQVSALTVRRDLDALQAEGFVERFHGGARAKLAVRSGMDQREISFFLRRDAQVAEKRAIARAAAGLLEPESVLVVDASTTCLYLARAIPVGMPLTVLTYSAFLPVELAPRREVEVISTGGLLHRKSLCYLGEDTEQVVAHYHARQALFGAKGVSRQAGCTDALLPEIRLKAAMLRQVEELIVLADHTKLGNIGLAAFARLNQVNTLVTDAGADPEMVAAIRDQGVRVIVASPVENGEV